MLILLSFAYFFECFDERSLLQRRRKMRGVAQGMADYVQGGWMDDRLAA